MLWKLVAVVRQLQLQLLSVQPALHGDAAGIVTSVPTQMPFFTVEPTEPAWVSLMLAIRLEVALHTLPLQQVHAISGAITTFFTPP